MCQRLIEENAFYTQEQMTVVSGWRIPEHIAFIPDGNRRWARQNKLSISQGHRAGADNLISTVKAAKALGVKVVTFYSISTENWSRDPLEVRALLWLLESYLTEQCQTMIDNGIRFQTIGDLTRFPKNVLETIQETKDKTSHCTEVEMVLALNYGSRDEMKRAIVKMLNDVKKSAISVEEVTEQLISSYLDTSPWKDPDLLIRTSGEKRLSNFLLWQTSYSEIYFANVFWPGFSSSHLYEAVLDFQQRERRLGN